MKRRLFSLVLACLVLTSLAPLTGCSHASKIHYNYDADGTPVTFRRIERHLNRDFWHHWKREVYLRPAVGLDRHLTADQQPIVKELGLPDWVRRPFNSLDAERVDEWVYVDAMQVFQFVGGSLVFQGPLTEYEQTLLRHGYPSKAITSRSDTGRREDLLVYDRVFMPEMNEFFFVDGMQKQKQEGD